jgi:hypothetical protein
MSVFSAAWATEVSLYFGSSSALSGISRMIDEDLHIANVWSLTRLLQVLFHRWRLAVYCKWQNITKSTWPFLVNGESFEEETLSNVLLAQKQDGIEASTIFELRSIFWD